MGAFVIGAAILGSFVLLEGLQAVLEQVMGDPEADVTMALQQLAAKNQRRAFNIAAVEQEGEEHLQEQFAGFNQISSRLLTQEALSRMPQPMVRRGSYGSPPATELLDMVSQQLGVSSEDLIRVSSPSRMGDMSSIYRAVGVSPPTSTPAPTSAPAPGSAPGSVANAALRPGPRPLPPPG